MKEKSSFERTYKVSLFILNGQISGNHAIVGKYVFPAKVGQAKGGIKERSNFERIQDVSFYFKQSSIWILHYFREKCFFLFFFFREK